MCFVVVVKDIERQMKKILLFTALFVITLVSCIGGVSSDAKARDKEAKALDVVETQGKTKIVHLTLDEFRQKIANIDRNTKEWKYLGDKPAIIDFYADWCGPCKKIAPILEELANEYAEEIYIYKVDTDKEQVLASLFGIRSIPALLFVPMEGEPQMAHGALPKDKLKQGIDEVLLLKK